ncbi:hypothetical protein ACVHNB_22135 [Streptomyces sp. YJ-C3]
MAITGRLGRLAVLAALSGAVLLAPAGLVTPAYAGAVCVANKDAAISAENNPLSATVGFVDKGRQINAGSTTNPEMFQVSNDAGDRLGYLRRPDLDC